jgi:hypothetical protein
LFLLSLCACSPPKQIPGVVVPEPGNTLASLPGPMPNFGPFETAADAIFAACPFILSKPHAVAGRESDPNFKLYFQLSTEYCGLLYYTPDKKIEMSMLATAYAQDDSGVRKCPSVSSVDDQRYPSGSLKYVYILHNHVYAQELSDKDIHLVVDLCKEHGFHMMTQDKDVYLGIIAFFSNGTDARPTCDGFFQYVPALGMMWKWTFQEGQWHKDPYKKVIWTSPSTFEFAEIR